MVVLRSLRACALVAFACAVVWASGVASPAGAASSSTVVDVVVPSATTLGTTNCGQLVPNRTDFGVVLPGSSVVTSLDCELVFGSSNDSSMLRVARSGTSATGMYQIPKGTLDTTWDGDGIAALPPSRYVYAATRDVNGKLIVVGERCLSPCAMYARRFNANGTVDVDGWGAYPSSTDNMAFGVAATPDGGFALAGHTSVPALDPQVQHYTAAGALDTSFSGDGMWAPVMAGDQTLYGVAAQPDGKLVAVGLNYNGPTYEWLLMRLNTDGTLDSSFGAGGIVTDDINATADDAATDVAVLADGSLLVAGTDAGSAIVVRRYTSTGVLDTTFGVSGERSIAVNNADTTWTWTRGQNVGMAVMGDGRIVVSGSTKIGGKLAVRVARLTAAGAMDATFGSGGVVDVDLDPSNDDAGRAVAVDGAGDVYLGGNVFTANELRGIRLTPTGALDTTWDADGIRPFGIPSHEVGDEYLGAAAPVMADDGGVYFVGVDQVAKSPAVPVPDFASGTADWSAGAGGMFGVCLRDVSAGATTDGTTWANDADHDCADGNPDPWRAIPATIANPASKVAFRGASGTSTAYLRFGMRTSTGQAPGRYLAPVAITVLAPTA